MIFYAVACKRGFVMVGSAAFEIFGSLSRVGVLVGEGCWVTGALLLLLFSRVGFCGISSLPMFNSEID